MRVGDALTPLERVITQTDMVAYAGATWDWHRLHHDAAFAKERGLAAPVVDGQMLGALMARQLMDALGPRAFVVTLAFRLRSMVFVEETVRVEGEVTSAEPDTVAVAQRVTVGERLAADGTAVVRR